MFGKFWKEIVCRTRINFLQVHELRLEMVGLQAKFSSVSAEESASRAKLAELRNEKKMVEADLERRTDNMKRTVEAVEEQLRAAKTRERDLLAERESATKSFHASLSVRSEDMERMKRSLSEAEHRSAPSKYRASPCFGSRRSEVASARSAWTKRPPSASEPATRLRSSADAAASLFPSTSASKLWSTISKGKKALSSGCL